VSDTQTGRQKLAGQTPEGWDDDPLSLEPTERWARRFRLGVRVLLGLATVWLVWSLYVYLSHGGLGVDMDDPQGYGTLVLSTVVFLVLLALEILKPLAKPDARRIRSRFGWVSGFATVLCLAGIVLSWVMVYGKGSEETALGTLVNSPAQANQVLHRDLPNGGTGYTRLPTGVFIQSIEFKGTSNVAVSGYVWQRVPNGLPIKPGVVLPEAGDAYNTTKVYEEKQSDGTLMGWYFNAEIRQLFDYGAYPLDKQNVWLRMWPTDFNTNVVLTPDFAGYPPWKIHNLQAMDGQMVYGDWNPDFTGYSYVNNQYSSNFGYQKAAGISGSSTPELYFNVGLKRDPQGPLYGQLIRWLFIALIVFAALFLITVDEEQREVVGFTTFEVMSFAVGMLLVIVFDQNAIRDATGARGVVYLEYFSYALYFMILMVGLNAMMITAKARFRALAWGGNLLPKLLYWPGYFGLVLIATVLAFF
jgi:hypothetical protein